jgi:Xaa-Pro dipeptidase
MITSTNITKRQSRLYNAIQEANLDALVLNPGPSLVYMTGLHFHLSERPVVVIFTPGVDPFIVLPKLESAKVKHLDYPMQAFTYGEDPVTWVDAFQAAANQAGLKGKKIGVEPRGLRFLELDLLTKAIPGAHFQAADNAIAALRMYKDESEIANIQQAADIAQAALLAILPMIKPGVTENTISSDLSMELTRQGSNPRLPFFPIVSGGPNSANPHAAPSDRPLQEGDLLVIDYGANVGGYLSDITRTFAIGEVDPEFKKIGDIVLAANQAGREAVKPGATAGSVDHAARSIIEAEGYGKYFFHRTGHGLGLEGHEDPYIISGSDLVLEPGMTFTVEPGIYLPDRNGVRIEDDVVVNSEGVHSFTSLQRELIQLPFKG